MNENLPNFLIVGAAKSGTTSLVEYLKQHKDIFIPKSKEPKFLTYSAGIKNFKGPGDKNVESEIIKIFPDYQKLYSESNHILRGDASVDLLYYWKEAIPQIKRYLSDPKIIIVLRNPIDRAYSNFLHMKRDLRENLSFENAIEAESERIKNNYEFIWHYIQVGKYTKQVEAYQKNFSEVKIVLFDDLKHNTEQTIKEIIKFLGADEYQNIDVNKISNISGVPKNYILQKFLYNNGLRKIYRKFFKDALWGEKIIQIREEIINKNIVKITMDPSMHQKLQEIFYEDIKQLEHLIDVDLTDWLI